MITDEIDILNRESKREQRVEHDVAEFTISQLVKAGMTDYTHSIIDLINSDSKLRTKKVIEGMYRKDEATLALLVMRTVISCIINADGNMLMMNTITGILSKSVMQSKSLSRLEKEHATLDAYMTRMYKRKDKRRVYQAKLKTAFNIVVKTQEEQLLEEGACATGVAGMLIGLLAESIDLIEIIKLDARSCFQGVHFPKFKPDTWLIRFTEDTSLALLDLDDTARMFMKPSVLPCLERPIPVTAWSDNEAGLNEGRPRTVIKFPRKKQNLKEFKHFIDAYHEENPNPRYLEAHKVIEDTCWTINSEILEVVEEVFKNNMLDTKITYHQGEHFEYHPKIIGDLPRRYSVEPDRLIDKTKFGTTITTEKGFVLFAEGEKKALNRYNNVVNDMYGFNEANLNKALQLQSMLNIANDFKNKKFWYTYQYDTRGRIYVVQGGLNPQSNAVGKALLKFAEGEALTETGRYWAKVHGGNCLGYDKELLDVRVAEIDRRIDEIKLVAQDPILHFNLWAYADDPYGYLAFILEYVKTLEDPEYPYALAVALDATCSGIQIYSGLLRDLEGAKAVNVVGQVRSDIYGLVATEANRMLTEGDYERFITIKKSDDEEEEFDFKPIAESLKGKINRSITKRNTMTQPYSVTMRGMQDQLKETFEDLEKDGKKFWVGETWQVSRLLADINQRAIDSIVKGAKQGKDFIKAITDKVSDRNKGLFYTSYLDFPVYQKSLKTKSVQVNTTTWTPHQGTQRVQYRRDKVIGKVNKKTQQSASAPNFVHSNDASLLGLTCIRTYNRVWEVFKKKCSFALVHDSYGVLPNNVPILGEEVRESFIEMFSDDVLIGWAITVLDNAGYTMDEIEDILEEVGDPMLDTLDLNEVRKATFFFS